MVLLWLSRRRSFSAFTPCVLPMYPLISGIVLGGKQRFPDTQFQLEAVRAQDKYDG
jgi:cytochrome c biogenesis protein CcdA